jgi:peptidoglycan/LPS O-acetylase OafA/YrhL
MATHGAQPVALGASPEASPTRPYVDGFDLVRGVAALLVVLGHARMMIFGVEGLPNATGITAALLAPTGVAEEAVAVFFVLSGYLVGGSVVRQVRRRTFSCRNYLVARMSRLWSVLLPGLALTLAADAITTHFFHREITTLLTFMDQPGDHSIQTVACNAAFLQTLRCPNVSGTNFSLWSLSYEFWYYIAFAAITVAVVSLKRRQRFLRASVCALSGAIALIVLGDLGILLGIPWVLGASLAACRPLGKVTTTRTWCAAAVLLTGIGASQIFIGSGATGTPLVQRFTVVGIASVPLVLCMRSGGNLSGPGLNALHQLGPWSYSLYVFHAPLLVAIASGFAAAGSLDRDAARVISTYVAATVVAIASYGLYQITERHTPQVRSMMTAWAGAPR